jgi:pimeloyl-ACP methyl ester carboxylesterase
MNNAMEKKIILLVMSLSLVSACAGLPGKRDVVLGHTSIEYALKGTGGPVVVFEAGLGGGMDTWAPVFDAVSTFTTVFAYNRRGYGESGKPIGSSKALRGSEIAKTAGEVVLDAVLPGASTIATAGTIASRADEDSGPREGGVIVSELYQVLEKAEVKPPYLLVGHSLGGLYVSLFARLHPKDIAGVVLVDAMHPEQIDRCQQYLPAKECDPQCYPWWVKMLIKLMPGVIRAEMAGTTETGREIRAAGPLPAVPLIVISHGKPPADKSDRERMWAALQQDLVDESTCGTHIIARKSGHNIQSDEPDLVIEAIRDIVVESRNRAHAVLLGDLFYPGIIARENLLR